MKKVKLLLGLREAFILFSAASQMEDDAVEHYGRRSADALTRALNKLRTAMAEQKAPARRTVSPLPSGGPPAERGDRP